MTKAVEASLGQPKYHFAIAFPALFAGCGTKVGQVIGATSPDGTEVTDRPVNAAEFLTTLCHILEVDGKSEFDSTNTRPIRDDGVMVPPLARTTLFDEAIKPILELVPHLSSPNQP
ncbi:MAG: DUF1501 domain-containing protein [Planctomycetaceae bacterium]